MKTRISFFAALALSGVRLLLSQNTTLSPSPERLDSTSQDWANYVRIGAYGLEKGGIRCRSCGPRKESGVFGIEVDNDIPGRYESYVHRRKIEGDPRRG